MTINLYAVSLQKRLQEACRRVLLGESTSDAREILSVTKKKMSEIGFEYHGTVGADDLQVGLDYDGEVETGESEFHRWTGPETSLEDMRDVIHGIAGAASNGSDFETDFFKGIISAWSGDWDLSAYMDRPSSVSSGVKKSDDFITFVTLRIRK